MARGMFVILLPTLECNLACTYCFEEHPKGRWDLETTAAVLDSVFELARREGASRLTLHWQGGEALLMGFPYWERTCAMVAERAAALGLPADQKLQTNLVGYSSQYAPLVRTYFGGAVGSSFEPGSARRYLHGDDGSRFRAKWLDAHRRATEDGLKVGVLSLLSREALDAGAPAYLERMRDEHGIRRLRINLPFDQSAGGGKGYWIDPVEAGAFLVDAYRFWVAQGRDEGLYLKPFQFLEDLLVRGQTREPGLCIFTSNCADVSLCVGPDGTVTLCDSFVSTDVLEPFGNLFEEPLFEIYRGASRQRARTSCMTRLEPKCASCRYVAVCHGGCPVRSHLRDDRSYHYCETYKMLCGEIERVAAKEGARVSLPVLH